MERVLKSICSLIQNFLQLDNEHIYIYNNKWKIPKDEGLVVCVGCQGIKTISNNSYFEEINGDFSECLEVKANASISINIYSYNTEALYKKEQILMALNSTNSQNLQNLKGFKIFRLPNSFLQANERDGTKILNRFILEFNVIYSDLKVNGVDYYDNISNALLTINN